MLSGFNTNVRHKGVLFHVQTEDSGRGHPHVITHLFHGGNILASEKQGYEHLLEEDDLVSQVKRLMDEQHGSMLEQLTSGSHDRVIRERLGSRSASPSADSASPPSPGPDPVVEPGREGSSDPPSPPSSEPALEFETEPAPRGDSQPEPARAAPDAAAEREPQRPLDEVVLDYLLDSARKRTTR